MSNVVLDGKRFTIMVEVRVVALIARTVRLPARIWDEVDALASKDGVSSAEVVREAVIRLLERHAASEKEKPPASGGRRGK